MKIIKTDRRTNLHMDSLSDLLEIQIEGPPLSDISPTEAVRLWWEDYRTTRRVNQEQRKPYKPRTATSEAASSSPEETTPDVVSLALNDWDNC